MRHRESNRELTVQAIAGTHCVLLGIDLEDPAGCLGFAIHRTDHTEAEAYWLRGLKVFPSIVPNPAAGMDFSLRTHPLQGFQWGDYSAKPDHDYTYRVVALGGTPAALVETAETTVRVSTEPEDDGAHGIWFNRGVAGSQAFVKRFGQYTPPPDAGEDHPAFAWLSRGLGEAFVRFVARATDNTWSLRGAFYEFTWKTGLRALAAAAAAAADVSLVVHGRDKDGNDGADDDTTADDNRAAVTATGLDSVVRWRTAPNKAALQHNKFLVLSHGNQPVAVWTGSTNLTQGGIFGHLNVGHLISDPTTAGRFLRYWDQLVDQTNTTTVLRTWTETDQPGGYRHRAGHRLPRPLATGDEQPLLDWYAATVRRRPSSAHITGAFGINKVFRDSGRSTGTSSAPSCSTRGPTRRRDPDDRPDVRVVG